MLLIFSHHPLQPTEKTLPQPHTGRGEEQGEGDLQGDLPPEVGIVVEKIAGVAECQKCPSHKCKKAHDYAKGQKAGIGSCAAEGRQDDGRHVEKADRAEGNHGGVAEGVQKDREKSLDFSHSAHLLGSIPQSIYHILVHNVNMVKNPSKRENFD